MMTITDPHLDARIKRCTFRGMRLVYHKRESMQVRGIGREREVRKTSGNNSVQMTAAKNILGCSSTRLD